MTFTAKKTNPPLALLWFRSLVFWLVFGLLTLFFAILILILFPLSHDKRQSLIMVWARIVLWSLAVTCKLHYEIRGAENIPSEPCIVFSKHQSTWETIALQLIIKNPIWVAKRELLWLPFFGWGLALMKTIAIKRGTGHAAVEQLVSQGRERLDNGFHIIIFPEGTRIAPGTKGRYRIGGAVLAERSGYPIVPVAHNAGEYWPRRSFIKRPGVIQVRIGPVITSDGKTAQQILDESSSWIEETMAEITILAVRTNH